MNTSFLIIGSNSFSGSRFIDFLLSKNNKVFGISRSNEISNKFLKYKKNENIKKFKFFKCSLANTKKIAYLIQKNRISIVVNFAAQGMVEQSWHNPLDWYKTNTMDTINLLERIKKIKTLKKFIQFSTPEVFGSVPKWVSENQYFNPSTPYAASRACADYHIKLLNQYQNFNGVITRTANVYGSHQQLYRFVPKLILSCLKGDKFYLDGNGSSSRSFIHINDVSEALYKISNSKKKISSINISSKKIVSIRMLAKIICKKLNCDPKEILVSKTDRIGKDKYYMLNSNALRKNLKWKDKISLNKGIDETKDWILENFNYFKTSKLFYKHKK